MPKKKTMEMPEPEEEPGIEPEEIQEDGPFPELIIADTVDTSFSWASPPAAASHASTSSASFAYTIFSPVEASPVEEVQFADNSSQAETACCSQETQALPGKLLQILKGVEKLGWDLEDLAGVTWRTDGQITFVHRNRLEFRLRPED